MDTTEEQIEETAVETRPKRFLTLLDYLPAIVSFVLTLITFILYATVKAGKDATIYFDMFVIALVPFALVCCNRKWSLGVPRYLVVLMCAHLVMSVDMGTALGVYGVFKWWDSFVHCFFGALCAATLYFLFIRWRKRKPEPLENVIIVLLVISLAALWEVYEFVVSPIIHSDMQDVQSYLARGLNPLTDTMVDIVLAAAGAIAFTAVLFVRYLFKRRKEKKKKS